MNEGLSILFRGHGWWVYWDWDGCLGRGRGHGWRRAGQGSSTSHSVTSTGLFFKTVTPDLREKGREENLWVRCVMGKIVYSPSFLSPRFKKLIFEYICAVSSDKWQWFHNGTQQILELVVWKIQFHWSWMSYDKIYQTQKEWDLTKRVNFENPQRFCHVAKDKKYFSTHWRTCN